MNEQQALALMVRPGAVKKKWNNGIIQVWVTRACDKACFGCTQGSQLAGRPGMITPEQFEEAVVNLADYHGTVGVFGGNPAMHPKFDQLCNILAKHIPFHRRGLWCNHPLGHGVKMRQTFNPGCSNLNVHQDQAAYDEFKRDWPESVVFGLDGDSRHSPPWGSMLDLEYLPGGIENTEENRYEFISHCDINRHWSGLYGVFRSQLRFWFCEIAGAHSMLKQADPSYPDTGLPVTPRVWDRSMQEYAEQVRHHCHRCTVCLNGFGELANNPEGTEHITKEYADIFKPKRAGRLVQLVTTPEEMQAKSLSRMTDYIQNGRLK